MESHINQERPILWNEDDERAGLKLEFCSITVTTEAAGLYERATIISLNWKLKEDLNRSNNRSDKGGEKGEKLKEKNDWNKPNNRSDKGGLYTKRKSASNGREGIGRPGRDSSDHVCQYHTGELAHCCAIFLLSGWWNISSSWATNLQVNSPVIECMYKESCKKNLIPLYIPRIEHFYFILSPIDI